MATTQFEGPFRVLADGLGNLFVLELGPGDGGGVGTIRRVDIAARATTTFGCPGQVSMGPQAIEANLQLAVGATLKAGYDFGSLIDGEQSSPISRI